MSGTIGSSNDRGSLNEGKKIGLLIPSFTATWTRKLLDNFHPLFTHLMKISGALLMNQRKSKP
jgi:hypothetical protein